MNLKIPPVIVFLICSFFMWILHRLNLIELTFNRNIFVVIFFWIIGAIIGILALRLFKNAKTTSNPFYPEKTSKLVTSGVYKFSRNPMYLALLSVLIGGCVYFGTWLNSLILLLYIWYMTKFQIKPEEKILSEKYGNLYLEYCKKVRRWF